MKRLAELGRGTFNGYLSPCARCGLVVAHTRAGVPYHMHRYSNRCAALANLRKIEAERVAKLGDRDR